MKFWLTVVVGVIVVAAGSTALMVLSPSPPLPTEAAPAAAPDPEKQAIAEVVDQRMEVSHTNLAQHQTGQDVFAIRNAGKSTPLIVTPLKASCQCTDMFLSDHVPSPSEPAPKLDAQRADYAVKPGEVVYVVARWDTKEKLGKQTVGVPVALTNDPHKTQLQFRINLDIHKEIVASADRIEFGMVKEGQTKAAAATITSLVHDKFDVEKVEVGSKFFEAKAVPLTPEELKAAAAKSGYRIELRNTGKNPVGAIDDVIRVAVRTPKTTERLGFTVSGLVIGDIETDLRGSTIDFKEVTAGTYRPKTVKVFAPGLKDNEALRLGTVKPAEVLAAKLEKNPKYREWVLEVKVKADAPGGPIHGGQISLVDGTGRERLMFRVLGIVDPAFTRTAAR